MNKFRHIILVTILAFASLFSLVSSASAQCGSCPSGSASGSTSADLIFINRINDLVFEFDDAFQRVERTLGVGRAITLSGGIVGISVSTLELQAGVFGLPMNRFLVSEVIARSAGVPTVRVVQSLGNRTFGQVALQFGVPLRVLTARLGGFTSLFLSEVAINSGTVQPSTNDELIAALIRAIQSLDSRFQVLIIRLGDSTFEAIIIARLATETNTNIDVIRELRNRFRELSIANFSAALLAASTLSAATMAELGFVLEDFTITTPYGAARALGANGIPVQIAVSRIDTFQRVVRADASMSQ